ncbi:proline iminopeptidase [Aliiroseovarius sediminilitoris]|uniref:Proline iminopeptidase n=1 Tax=Aliiroseovarius sediminilitoris TaxID=1173584 RepID=A0A1I0MR48_9RHOB|nr:prolyl aminopeptidase [Aliiroseovarius sediminilitoris]SEV91085.1 proline iminopeptidase [Aliiroseovarius sediminilitoris]
MDKAAGKNNATARLHPPIDPFDRRMLDVGDGHRIYVEQSGNPHGIPVVVFHGGPGGGSSPAMRRFFDPDDYRIILFDQRGCGRSRPHASIEANTTWHLVQDIEHIRLTLGVDRWVVFGGSWGATLALIYAQTHPSRVAWLVLRGVFLATQTELTWFYGGGAGRFWPELWERFESLIPEDERHDMIAAYNRRLFSGNPGEEARFAKAWTGWENALASINNTGTMIDSPADYARAFARLENHYFTHGAFLETDGQILRDMPKIAHIPGTIVQGRHDMICPPTTAYRLHQRWPSSDLRMIHMAGHALSERGIADELIRTMEKLARQRDTLGA